MSNLSENQSCPRQHNHEVLGSTKIAGCCEYAHNHRFATVSGEAIPCDGSHVHEVTFTTDTCNGHKHEFCGKTGLAKDVGCEMCIRDRGICVHTPWGKQSGNA